MPTWIIEGVNGRTGANMRVRIDAADEGAAELQALNQGIVVRSIEGAPIQPLQATIVAPPHAQYQNRLPTCPVCGLPISPAASVCPRCAHPMHQSGLVAGRLNPRHTGQIVTIEKTGKGLKAQGCLSVLMLMVGVIVLIAAPQNNNGTMLTWGFCMLFISIVWIIYVRVATWWRHG